MSTVLTVALILGAVMSMAAGLIWVERRLLGLLQDRLGPNRTGPAGILQPLADVIKLLTKEDWTPPFARKGLFRIAPALVVVTTLMSFAVVPVGPGFGVADLNVGLLFVLGMTSLAAYSVVLAGWASRSRYPMLGAVRAAAQMLTYEVFLGLSLMGVVLLAGSFDLRVIVEAQADLWFAVPQFVGLAIFLLAALAESHRAPLDLPEAESELVAGYHSEYSSMKFALFFVGEYLSIVLAAALVTVLFLGGWHGPWLPGVVWFQLKMLAVIGLVILMRASLPRPRYDQLMRFGWKVILPLALLNLLLTGLVALVL